MASKKLYVWEIQYVLRNGHYDGPTFSSDILTAPTFAKAVERATVEARRFRAAVKVRSVVCKMRLTA